MIYHDLPQITKFYQLLPTFTTWGYLLPAFTKLGLLAPPCYNKIKLNYKWIGVWGAAPPNARI